MKQSVISEYLRRSYFAVDGLWFMMIENEFSFDKALEVDTNVWRILPKIQARKVKELLGIQGRGLSEFLQAIKVKLEAEQYDYQINKADTNYVQIAIKTCPWYDILKKANREHLEPKIADAICSIEFQVWLKEFGENLEFHFTPARRAGESSCILHFRSNSP